MTQKYPSLELLYELAVRRQDQQSDQVDALISKATTLLGFDAVLLGLVAASDPLRRTWRAYLTLSVGLLVLACLLFAGVLFARRYRFDPKLRPLRERYLAKTDDVTRLQVIDQLIDATEHTEKRLRILGGIVNAGAVLTAAGLAVAGAGVLATHWNEAWR